eukprot:5592030-Pyramimonas_sp.AAC.1
MWYHAAAAVHTVLRTVVLDVMRTGALVLEPPGGTPTAPPNNVCYGREQKNALLVRTHPGRDLGSSGTG